MIGNSLHLQPQPLPTILLAILVPLFIGLGFWQLDRAEQKRAIGSLQHSRLSLPPLNLNQDNGLELDSEEAEYRSLTATGILDPEMTIFLENRKFQGRQGFHVFTPLLLDGVGRHLLINRGWVAAGPGLSLPVVDYSEGPITVTGRASLPSPPALRLGAPLDQSGNRRWPYITLEDYSKWSGLELYPFLLLQTAPLDEGFRRVWPIKPANDTLHIGYALQWFAFALISLLIWLRLSLIRHGEEKVTDAEV